MKIILFPKHVQKVHSWKGGISRELLILPATATFEERNFDLRISEAEVNIPESDFSDLRGYNRNLLLLQGEIELQTGDGREIHMKPGDEWNFDGSLPVHCKGNGKDFNVIWKGPGIVSSQMMHMQVQETAAVEQNVGGQMVIFYIASGKVTLTLLGEEYKLNAGSSLVVDAIKEPLNIRLLCTQTAQVVLSEILAERHPWS